MTICEDVTVSKSLSFFCKYYLIIQNKEIISFQIQLYPHQEI